MIQFKIYPISGGGGGGGGGLQENYSIIQDWFTLKQCMITSRDMFIEFLLLEFWDDLPYHSLKSK